jgi:hypothetical protein
MSKVLDIYKYYIRLLWVFLASVIGVIEINATTVYVYGERGNESQTVNNWTTSKHSFNANDVQNFTVTISSDVSSGFFTSAGVHFIAFSTAESNFNTNPTKQVYFEDFTLGKSGSVSYAQTGYDTNCGDNCKRTWIKYGLSEGVSAITITVTGNQQINLYSCSCGSTSAIDNLPKVYSASISTGDAPAPEPSEDTWYLVGEVAGGWATEGITGYQFTSNGNDNELELTLYLDKSYANDNSHGFKIIENHDPDQLHWYGSNSIITNVAYENIDCSGNSGNCGITIDGKGYYTFIWNTYTKHLTVEYPDKVTTAPTVRWGKQATISSQNIIGWAYIADQGCTTGSTKTVNELRVRFWKEDDPDNKQIVTTTTGSPYSVNNSYSITIPSTNEVLLNCDKATDYIVMEVAGRNSGESTWSSYSDRMRIPYSAVKAFVVTPPSDGSFTSCEGSHQILISSMVNPSPDDFTVTSASGPDAVAGDFSRSADGNYLVWDNTNKEAQTGNNKYSYTFTFDKEGYPTSSAVTFSFNYAYSVPEVGISDITASPESSKAWETISLTAVPASAGDYGTLVWKVTPVSGVLEKTGDLTATFRGNSRATSTTYTVTVQGQSGDCATSTEAIKTIVVYKNDAEGCD